MTVALLYRDNRHAELWIVKRVSHTRYGWASERSGNQGEILLGRNGALDRIRAVQLRRYVRQVHSRSQPLRLRTRVPCSREGEGPHLPPVSEALNRAPRLLLVGL